MIAFSVFPSMAKELVPFNDTYLKNLKEEIKVADYSEEMKVAYLTKLIEQLQISYSHKVSYLEAELGKTQDRLIQKSINQEKIEEAMKDKYKSEALALRRELASTTKAMLEYQRQLEKIKPSDEVIKMIRLNTELAVELRKSADQFATLQLRTIESSTIRSYDGAGKRMPASVNP